MRGKGEEDAEGQATGNNPGLRIGRPRSSLVCSEEKSSR